MRKLQFGTREHTLEAFQDIFNPSTDMDGLLRMKGITEAVFLFDEYFDTSYLPLLKGERRDEFFMKKLRRIKERYFDPI